MAEGLDILLEVATISGVLWTSSDRQDDILPKHDFFCAASGFETVISADTASVSTKVQQPSRETNTEASTIVSSASPLGDNSRVKVSHVCYDDYIDEAHRRNTCARLKNRVSLKDTEEGEGIGDTEKQKDPCTADITSAEDSHDTKKPPPFESEWYHEGRRDAMAVIEALAAGRGSPAMTKTRTVFDNGVGRERRVDGTEEEGALLHVVLADDNMHFRSMRHEVLRVARVHGCGYVQVYFPTDVDAAVARDAMRRSSVSEATIRKMAGQFQTPDPVRFPWERHTMIIEPSVVPQPKTPKVLAGRREATQGSSKVSSVHEGDIVEVRDSTAAMMRSFWQMVAAAADDPVPPSSVSSTDPCEKMMDREATKASRLHHLDLELRKAVKRVSEKAVSFRLTREALRSVMTACSAARKSVMSHARAVHKEAGVFNRGRTGVNTNCKIDDPENGVGIIAIGDHGSGVANDIVDSSLGVKTGGEAGCGGDGSALGGDRRKASASAIGPPEKLASLSPVEECSRRDPALEAFAHHFSGALTSVELGGEVREGLVDAARGLAWGHT